MHFGQFEYFAKQNSFKIINKVFSDTIKIQMEIPDKKIEEFTNSNNNKSFKIIKYDILAKKIIDK